MAVTLNGIAQGFITDRVTEMLRDRGFEHVPAIEHLQGWLTELMAA